MANTYEKIYVETATEIKNLLQEYSLAASPITAAAAADDKTDGNNSSMKQNELQMVLDELARRPEFVLMDEVKTVLQDCGIEVEVREKADGGRFVNVQLKN